MTALPWAGVFIPGREKRGTSKYFPSNLLQSYSVDRGDSKKRAHGHNKHRVQLVGERGGRHCVGALRCLPHPILTLCSDLMHS